MRIWILLFTLVQIRILLLIKVIGICEHWSIGPPGLHCEHPQPVTALSFLNFTLMRIGIQLFTLLGMRIRVGSATLLITKT
jgi:hypothetical protein